MAMSQRITDCSGLAGTSVGLPVQLPCRSRVTYSRLHRTLSRRVLNISRTYSSWYFLPSGKQTLFIGKNPIKCCSTKSTQNRQCKQQSQFQYLQENFSVLRSCLMEERMLTASHSSAPLLLSLIASCKCRTCSCHGFFSLWFQRKKLGLLIRREKWGEKNIPIAKGILSNHILKETVF